MAWRYGAHFRYNHAWCAGKLLWCLRVSLTFKDFIPWSIRRVVSEDTPVSEGQQAIRTERLVALAFSFAVLLAVCWIYWRGIPAGPGYYVGTVVMGVLLLLSVRAAIEVDTSYTNGEEGGTVVFGPWGLVEICTVVLVGPTWATVANVMTSAYVGRRDWRRIVWDVSGCAIRMHLAALVFGLYSGPLVEGGAAVSIGLGFAVAGAAVVLQAVDLSLASASMRARYGLSLRRIYWEQIHPYIAFEGLHLVIAVFVVLLLARNNVAGALVMLIAGAVATLVAYREHGRRRENKELKKQLEALQQRSAEEASAFARVILGRIGSEQYAARHAAATAVYAYDLARRMEFEEQDAKRVWLAGVLHNIGLFEHAGLGYGWDEMEEERCHPARGAAILAEIRGYDDIAKWVLTHHERIDGGGYPNGLPKNWIEREAQIISMSAAYASAVLDRPGGDGEGSEDPDHVRRKLLLEKGVAYDKDVANAFAVMLARASREYQRGQGERFEFPQSPIDALAEERSGDYLHPAQIEAVADQDTDEGEPEANEDRTQLTGWPTLGDDVDSIRPEAAGTDWEDPRGDGTGDTDGR